MINSFICAFKGAMSCIRTERNFRIHLAVGFYILLAAAAASLSKMEWIIILLCIGAVLGSEIFNTAIEKLCDALHPNRSALIGLIKDMTAGAVLMFAVSSAIIGGIIFISADKFSALKVFITERTGLAVLIAATIPLVVFLVFRRYEHENKISHDHDSRSSKRR